MKTRDGLFCREFALVSGENPKFEIGSHFGIEPTSKRSPSQARFLLEVSKGFQAFQNINVCKERLFVDDSRPIWGVDWMY